MLHLDSLLMEPVANNTWCSQCQALQQQLDTAQNEHLENFKALKEKIFSTDLLIKKYNSKCKEYDAQNKKLEETNKRVEGYQRDFEMMASKLKTSLGEIEPLRQANEKLEKKKLSQEKQVEYLTNQLSSSELIQKQYMLTQKKLDKEITDLEQEKKSLKISLKDTEIALQKREANLKRLLDDNDSRKQTLAEQKRLCVQMTKSNQRLQNQLSKCEELLRVNGLYVDYKRIVRRSASSTPDVSSITSSIAHTADLLSDEDSLSESDEDVEMIFQKLGFGTTSNKPKSSTVKSDHLKPLQPALSPLPWSPAPSKTEESSESEGDEVTNDNIAGCHGDKDSVPNKESVSGVLSMTTESMATKPSQEMAIKVESTDTKQTKSTINYQARFQRNAELAAQASKLRSQRVRKLVTIDDDFTSRRHSKTVVMKASSMDTQSSPARESKSDLQSEEGGCEEAETALFSPKQRTSRVTPKHSLHEKQVADGLNVLPDQTESTKGTPRLRRLSQQSTGFFSVQSLEEDSESEMQSEEVKLEVDPEVVDTERKSNSSSGIEQQLIKEDLEISTSEDEGGPNSPRRRRSSPRSPSVSMETGFRTSVQNHSPRRSSPRLRAASESAGSQSDTEKNVENLEELSKGSSKETSGTSSANVAENSKKEKRGKRKTSVSSNEFSDQVSKEKDLTTVVTNRRRTRSLSRSISNSGIIDQEVSDSGKVSETNEDMLSCTDTNIVSVKTTVDASEINSSNDSGNGKTAESAKTPVLFKEPLPVVAPTKDKTPRGRLTRSKSCSGVDLSTTNSNVGEMGKTSEQLQVKRKDGLVNNNKVEKTVVETKVDLGTSTSTQGHHPEVAGKPEGFGSSMSTEQNKDLETVLSHDQTDKNTEAQQGQILSEVTLSKNIVNESSELASSSESTLPKMDSPSCHRQISIVKSEELMGSGSPQIPFSPQGPFGRLPDVLSPLPPTPMRQRSVESDLDDVQSLGGEETPMDKGEARESMVKNELKSSRREMPNKRTTQLIDVIPIMQKRRKRGRRNKEEMTGTKSGEGQEKKGELEADKKIMENKRQLATEEKVQNKKPLIVFVKGQDEITGTIGDNNTGHSNMVKQTKTLESNDSNMTNSNEKERHLLLVNPTEEVAIQTLPGRKLTKSHPKFAAENLGVDESLPDVPLVETPSDSEHSLVVSSAKKGGSDSEKESLLVSQGQSLVTGNGQPKKTKDRHKKRKKMEALDSVSADGQSPPKRALVQEMPDESTKQYIKMIDRELQALTRVGEVDIGQISLRLTSLQAMVNTQLFADQILQLLEKCDTDVLMTDVRAGLKALEGDPNISSKWSPTLTQLEDRMVQLVHRMAEKMLDLPDILLTTSAKIIVHSSALNVLSKSSMCRVYAAMCQKLGQVERLRVLVYDLTYFKVTGVYFLLANCAVIWPEALRKDKNSDKPVSVLLIVLQLVFLKNQWFRGTPKQTTVNSVLRLLCHWEHVDVTETGLVTMMMENVDRLHKEGENQSQQVQSPANTDQLQESLRSLLLLAVHKEWEWTYTHLIQDTVYPRLKECITCCQDNFSSHLLTKLCWMCKLIGFLAVQCPPEEREKLDDILKYLQKICVGDITVPVEVQCSVVETVMLLTPYSPALGTDICQRWLQSDRDPGDSKQMTHRVHEYLKYYKQRLPYISV